MNKAAISSEIKKLAIEAGFDACGIAKSAPLTKDSLYLETWLAARYQAGMQYMENHFEKRIDPTKLVEGSKSVIVVLLNYFPENYPFENKKLKIARYALGTDYHFVMKDMLNSLLATINEQVCKTEGRAFVDSAPVMERAWAREAGLGWIGKNSLLLNKDLGSYFFIGELIVDIELACDQPIDDHCGTCRKCLDACPTRAIVSPKVVNSNNCLSYQTIENKGEIPEDIRRNMNGRIFGCDICQEVCPWNNKAKQHKIESFNPSETLKLLSDSELETLSEDKFKILFKNSAVKRAGFNGLKRNIEAVTSN
jgi:epoxyqueuosine reductase